MELHSMKHSHSGSLIIMDKTACTEAHRTQCRRTLLFTGMPYTCMHACVTSKQCTSREHCVTTTTGLHTRWSTQPWCTMTDINCQSNKATLHLPGGQYVSVATRKLRHLARCLPFQYPQLDQKLLLQQQQQQMGPGHPMQMPHVA